MKLAWNLTKMLVPYGSSHTSWHLNTPGIMHHSWFNKLYFYNDDDQLYQSLIYCALFSVICSGIWLSDVFCFKTVCNMRLMRMITSYDAFCTHGLIRFEFVCMLDAFFLVDCPSWWSTILSMLDIQLSCMTSTMFTYQWPTSPSSRCESIPI